MFETLVLFGPCGDRILLDTDAVSFPNAHCIGESHGYYFSSVASASQTWEVCRYMLQNPIHSRRNIIVVINFSYQLRSNFSFSRVIRIGDGRISKYRHRDSPQGINDNDQLDRNEQRTVLSTNLDLNERSHDIFSF